MAGMTAETCWWRILRINYMVNTEVHLLVIYIFWRWRTSMDSTRSHVFKYIFRNIKRGNLNFLSYFYFRKVLI